MPVAETAPERHRVGYVLKRYPRYSETFVVNEILAHEAAGLSLDIFSLFGTVDTHFQDILARVRAPVTYLPASSPKGRALWDKLEACGAAFPGFWEKLAAARGEDARTLHQALELALHVKERGLTHLHAHFATGATAVARLAARFAGIRYSFTAHAKDIFHESVAPADLARKLAEASGVVTVSDYNLAFLRQRYGAAARKVRRIYNGLDLAAFPYAAPADRPPLVLAVGRLVEKKGFADLVAACAILARRGVAFRCDIVGTGEEAAALAAQIAASGLSERVSLLGPLPQAEVKARIREAAAFAAPCVVGRDNNQDGLPTVLLESMALGAPCVSTDVTGIPEVLVHGETGLMVPQRDPAALADALTRLLHDAELRVRLARSARARVAADFDITRNAAALREVFAEAARPAVGAPG
jgi:colanic acid/amylovoran biosynthesis glycosyltransferase